MRSVSPSTRSSRQVECEWGSAGAAPFASEVRKTGTPETVSPSHAGDAVYVPAKETILARSQGKLGVWFGAVLLAVVAHWRDGPETPFPPPLPSHLYLDLLTSTSRPQVPLRGCTPVARHIAAPRQTDSGSTPARPTRLLTPTSRDLPLAHAHNQPTLPTAVWPLPSQPHGGRRQHEPSRGHLPSMRTPSGTPCETVLGMLPLLLLH